MPRLVLLLMCLGAFCSPRHLYGQLLVNGGFESPVLSPGSYLTITPGTEPSGFGWSVLSGSVDVGYTPILPFVAYPAYQGNQGLDLNGVNRGAIFQDFATVLGKTYTVSFAYADNPDELGQLKSASVVVTNVANSAILMSDNIFHSSSTNIPPNADFFIFGDSFVATGTNTRLTISSTSASNTASGGIFIDAVSVAVAVPEPSSLLLLGSAGVLGVSATTYWKRRKHNRKVI
ncbi:MAG TPA: DUF642 domain-containing protein [Gemmatales bacterium]|nr:DUF642 domain-containing protein [Gemmatales bacterium]